MALPGQTFKRVLVLLLDCGHSMQEPFHRLPDGDIPLKPHTSPLHATEETEAHMTAAATASDAAAPAALAAAATKATPLELMEACVLRYLENLTAGSARVDVALIAYGSPHTKNHLAPAGEKSEGYLHVEELLAPRPVSWHAAHVVEQHMQGVKDRKAANRSDWIDAVVVAADLLERTYGGKLLQHEVFFLLFSDFKSPPSSEEDLEPVQEHLKKLDIQLISVLISKPDAPLPPVLLPGTEVLQEAHAASQDRHPRLRQQQQQQERQQQQQQRGKQYVEREHRGLMSLWSCAAAVVPWCSFCSSAALRFPSLLRSRRLTTKCRVPLKISSSFSLPVLVFLQTKRESLPPLKKRVFFRSSSTGAAPEGGARAAGGEKKRQRSRTEEDAGEEEEEAAEADDAASNEKRRRQEEASPTKGGEMNVHEDAEAADAVGWRDVHVQRFYYRAQDPDRRPVHLATDSGSKLSAAPAAPREKAEAAVGATAAVVRDEEEAEKTASEPRQKLLGYRFGRDLVVISPLEQKVLKQSRRPAAIEVLGVVKQAKIKRWWITGNSEYVTSGLNCLPALLALRALVLALQRLSAALVCSFTWREGQPARPAVLLPSTYVMPRQQSPSAARGVPSAGDAAFASTKEAQEGEQQRCYGFHLVYLPYAEDMQMLRLPSLRSVSSAQLHAVEAFVKLLTFPTPGGAAAAAASSTPPPGATGAAASDAEAAAAGEAAARGGKQQRQEPAVGGLSAAVEAAAFFSCAALLRERRVSSNSGSNKGNCSSMYASLANPAVEVWSSPHPAAIPSPLCSSLLHHTFLCPGISSFSSFHEYATVERIPSPALERFCNLLVYRHHNPVTPRVVSSLAEPSKGGGSTRHSSGSSSGRKKEYRTSPLQQELLLLMWPPTYSSRTCSFHASPAAFPSPEAIFSWGVRPPHESGEHESHEAAAAAARKKAKSEQGTDGTGIAGGHSQKAAKDLLFAAFPLGTCAAAQQSLKERGAAGKQQLWGDVQQKQRQLQDRVERLFLKDVRLPPEADERDEVTVRVAAGGKGGTGGAKAEAAATAGKAAAGEPEAEDAAERAAEADTRRERIALLEKKLHVKSINPVGDFNRMLEVREVDLTEKAIKEIIAVIYRFLEAAKKRDATESHQLVEGAEDAGQQQLLGKAFACVTALREGCRREFEGVRFNNFLRGIKTAAYAEERQREAAGAAPHTVHAAPETAQTAKKQVGGAEAASRAAGQESAVEERENGRGPATTSTIFTFYMWLKKAKVSLITTAEDPRADVKPEESLSIYSDATAADEEKQLESRSEKPAANFSAEEQELLDLIE